MSPRITSYNVCYTKLLRALFPWRTINGEEASAYYAAGTAQYHINADIMYALKKYVEVSGDEAFLV